MAPKRTKTTIGFPFSDFSGPNSHILKYSGIFRDIHDHHHADEKPQGVEIHPFNGLLLIDYSENYH